MDETGQKNAILICTCIIVICFHIAYKFKNNQKLFNILIGIALFTSLCMTKFLRDWEKRNKTDYNLVLFIYILLDIVIFAFMVIRFCASRNILRGGGESSSDMTKYFVDEFKQQDKLVKFLDTPGVLKIANLFKEKAANFALRKIGFFGI
jgi:hypothetical protein